jgi:hypothetical protein
MVLLKYVEILVISSGSNKNWFNKAQENLSCCSKQKYGHQSKCNNATMLCHAAVTNPHDRRLPTAEHKE